METLDAIAKRASIRKFKPTSLKDGDLEKILKAGMEAPSAVNKRPYAFVVLKDKALWGQEAERVDHTTPVMREAPVSVAVIGDKSRMLTEIFMYEDAAAVGENMLLAATALGYGSLWNGIRVGGENQKYFDRALNLPEDKTVLMIMAFGYAGMENPRKDRFDRSLIHVDRW